MTDRPTPAPAARPDPTVHQPTADGANPTVTAPAGHQPPPANPGPYPFLSPPDRPGDLGRLGGYRVTRLVGEGGMGFVFRAEDEALLRPVALKVMRPEVAARPTSKDRFLREGRAAAALKSDHVVIIHQVGEANGVPFLAMEFLEGLSLEDWLKARQTPPDEKAVLKVARDVLKGLAAAHAKGLTHRDIKPANLWVEKGTGRIKVLDFGLTHVQGGSAEHLTASGAVMGTPAYMAPEQAEGLKVDHRADLFSLGVVLYRTVAGRSPFQRDGMLSTLSALATYHPPPPPGLFPAVGAVVMRLMTKSPADRPASAATAIEEFRRSAEGRPGSSDGRPVPSGVPVPPPLPPTAGRPGQKRSPAQAIGGREIVGKPAPRAGRRNGRPTAARANGVPLLLSVSTRRFVLIALASVTLIGSGVGGYLAFLATDSSPPTAGGGTTVPGTGAIIKGQRPEVETSAWVELHEPRGRYRVKFPTAPQALSESVQTPGGREQVEMHQMQDPATKEVFGSLHQEVPPERKGVTDDQVLDQIMEAVMAEARGATVADSKWITYQGFRGRDVTITAPMGERWKLMLLRVVLATDRVIVLMASGESGAAGSPRIKAFFESLKIE